MMQRICPICDHTMRSAHYCGNCKSWVRHPWVRDVTYYLNERHPERESGCSYHDSSFYGETESPETRQRTVRQAGAGAKQPGTAASKQPGGAVPNRPRAAVPNQPGGAVLNRPRAAVPNQPGGTVPNRPRAAVPNQPRAAVTGWPGNVGGNPSEPLSGRSRQSKKASGNSKIIILAVIICVLVELGAVSTKAVRKAVSSFSGNVTEYDIDLGDYTGEYFEEFGDGIEESYAYHELDDETVIAQGEACTGMGHFPVQGESLEEPVCRIMEQHGYQVSDILVYSSNEVSADEGSRYRTWLSVEVDQEPESGYQYVDINYDTATGELHQIEIFLEDCELASAVTEDMMRMLQERNAFPEGNEWMEEVGSELSAQFTQQVDFYFIYGVIEIDGYWYDNGCNVYISRTAEQ